MMSTYELVITFLSPAPPSNDVEIRTIQVKKVLIKESDEELNAINQSDL